MERKIHKERETEKGKFDDKEAFVTDAYRQKMELLKQEEEKERINDEIEGIVTRFHNCKFVEILVLLPLLNFVFKCRSVLIGDGPCFLFFGRISAHP